MTMTTHAAATRLFRALTLGASVVLFFGGMLVLDGTVTRADSRAAAANTEVTFPGFAYNPKVVTITVGSSVTWKGNLSFHPLQQSSQSGVPSPVSGGFGASSGTEYTRVFTQTGTFNYICTSHFGSGMFGEVRVIAPLVASVTPATPPTAEPSATPNQTAQPTPTRSSTLQPTQAPLPTSDPRLTQRLFLPLTVQR